MQHKKAASTIVLASKTSDTSIGSYNMITAKELLKESSYIWLCALETVIKFKKSYAERFSTTRLP